MEKSMYKGPGAGMSWVCLENSKGSVAAVRRRGSKGEKGKGRRRRKRKRRKRRRSARRKLCQKSFLQHLE